MTLRIFDPTESLDESPPLKPGKYRVKVTGVAYATVYAEVEVTGIDEEDAEENAIALVESDPHGLNIDLDYTSDVDEAEEWQDAKVLKCLEKPEPYKPWELDEEGFPLPTAEELEEMGQVRLPSL